MVRNPANNMKNCPCCNLTVAECMAGGIRLADIVSAAANAWDCAPEDVIGGGRIAKLVRARRLSISLFRELTKHSTYITAAAFNIHHGTVTHACRKMAGATGRERRVFHALLATFRKEAQP